MYSQVDAVLPDADRPSVEVLIDVLFVPLLRPFWPSPARPPVRQWSRQR